MKKKFLPIILSVLFFNLFMTAFGEDDATALYNKGIDFYEQDKIEQSISAFKKAISINPSFYEAYYNLSRIQEAMGKNTEAISSYEALLKIKPDDYESALACGKLLYKAGYLSKALSYLEKIPQTSQYKAEANTLSEKIKKRQIELGEEARIKAAQTAKTSVIGNVKAPSGLVIDSEGNMYVASYSENAIIKISKDGNQKTVFADKTKNISGPIGLAIDSCDNIYVANYTKGNIVKLDKNGASNVLMYAKKPYCISVDESKEKIYVTEQENNSVLSYDIKEILNNSPKKEVKQEKKEPKIIEYNAKDKTPIGTPSIIESSFTRSDPRGNITAPIMIPSDNIMEF